MDKDYLEYFDCEEEMTDALTEQYKQVERIVGQLICDHDFCDRMLLITSYL